MTHVVSIYEKSVGETPDFSAEPLFNNPTHQCEQKLIMPTLSRVLHNIVDAWFCLKVLLALAPSNKLYPIKKVV